MLPDFNHLELKNAFSHFADVFKKEMSTIGYLRWLKAAGLLTKRHSTKENLLVAFFASRKHDNEYIEFEDLPLLIERVAGYYCKELGKIHIKTIPIVRRALIDVMKYDSDDEEMLTAVDLLPTYQEASDTQVTSRRDRDYDRDRAYRGRRMGDDCETRYIEIVDIQPSPREVFSHNGYVPGYKGEGTYDRVHARPVTFSTTGNVERLTSPENYTGVMRHRYMSSQTVRSPGCSSSNSPCHSSTASIRGSASASTASSTMSAQARSKSFS